MRVDLVIERINDYKYFLKDSDMNEYILNMEFYDIDKLPKVGDKINMHKNMVNNLDNYLYSFGNIDGIYGKKIDNLLDEDIIVLLIDNKKIYLKRFYG